MTRRLIMSAVDQEASLVVQKLKDLHLEIARCWGISADVIAGATFGLSVTMMFESGYDEAQIVEVVRDIVRDLAAPANDRGAS